MCHCLLADQPVILHLEFQSAGDKKMARRLLEYNINAGDKYGSPVISCVIYLRKDSSIVLQEHGRHEVLSMGYLLASKVWTGEREQKWLRRRFEMLRDELRNTWVYQDILQEGREEGRELGIQEGEVLALRRMLLALVEKHSPTLQRLAQGAASVITEPAELQQFILKVSLSQTFEEAQSTLLEAMKESKN